MVTNPNILTPEQLTEYARLLENATPTPWKFNDECDSFETVRLYGGTLEDPVQESRLIDFKYDLANRELTAEAVNGLSALLLSHKELERQLSELSRAYSIACGDMEALEQQLATITSERDAAGKS